MPDRLPPDATARRRPGQFEGEVLAGLSPAGQPSVPAEFQAAVGGGLAYTTAMTVLVRLHD
jgi:hypothetical protein